MSTRATSITPRVACIEAGGTKMVVSIGTTVAEIRDNRHVITTRDPSATTREIPAAISASAQGGVLPKWLQGSNVT